MTLALIFLVTGTWGQVTSIVILDHDERIRLQQVIEEHPRAGAMYDSIVAAASISLQHTPRPLKKLYYEGLLDTDPARINTVKSFDDMNHMAALIYAAYGNGSRHYGDKAREIIMAWAEAYQPDGNTINENKFVSFFWGYHLFKPFFNMREQAVAEKWIGTIARMQMERRSTPNNNWESKRLTMIGIAGALFNDSVLMKYSADGYKKFISTAYYPDGTSNDLLTRDALHYHISGIKPCISAFINLSPYHSGFKLFEWEAANGASIKKAVAYTIPYATGEKQRREWVNSTVELDKRRAEAGIEVYRPGRLFSPEDAAELFEWACYYNHEWYSIIEKPGDTPYLTTWIGLLNSPLVRRPGLTE